MRRREFLKVALGGMLASTAHAALRPPRIVLRSSWQVVNIGDIAHTPGVLALLEKHIPDAEVTLWASGDLSEPVADMERSRFPRLTIVKGTIRETGQGSTPELDAALKSADFLLHGSGPSLVAEKDVAAFVRHFQKPFGVLGITYGGGSQDQRNLLSQARFVYFRDSVSLRKAQDDGITCPLMEFGPDGAFACDVRDDDAADAFLKAHQLETGQFLCCIPRLRYTPYWLIKKGRAFDEVKHRRNEERKDLDHAPLRQAITEVVRQTPLKILLCPEDQTQMQVGRENILDKLPEDVRDRVIWRETFWLTDEALSTYRRSAGLFGLEMHSPIMCVGNGIPAIVCRFAEQTSKGFMWRDIGLGEWLFDLDQPDDVARIVPAVLELARNPAAARDKVARASQFVRDRHAAVLASVRQRLSATP